MAQETFPILQHQGREASTVEGALPPESVSANTPESYQVGLEERDRRLVDVEAEASVGRYQALITSLDQRADAVEQRPARLAEVSERLTTTVVEGIAAESQELAADESTSVSGGIVRINKLNDTLQRLRTGASLADLPLQELGVALPKMALPKKKREVAEAALKGQLDYTCNRVLSEVNISSVESVLESYALDRIVEGLVTEGALTYVAEGRGELDIPAVGEVDKKLAVLVAVGRLDEARLRDRLQSIIASRLTARIQRLPRELPPLDVLEVTEDATLAGHVARDEIRRQKLDDALLAAYKRCGLAFGYGDTVMNNRVASLRSGWERRARMAEQKFADTVLPGDIVLEHYTPLALSVIRAGGLHPKARHGYTTTNDQSVQVHFTSDNGVLRPGGIDYAKYTRLSPGVRRAMRTSHEVRPVAGMFAASLAELVKGGLSCATYTAKKTHGGNAVEDMVLAYADGSGADFPIDKLDLVVMRFEDEERDSRLPYETAINAELVALRGIFAQQRGVEWSDLIAERLSYGKLARDVLKREGANPTWVDGHVFDNIEAVRAKHSPATPRCVIVPLARLRNKGDLSGEHVDGDSLAHQSVHIGLARASM